MRRNDVSEQTVDPDEEFDVDPANVLAARRVAGLQEKTRDDLGVSDQAGVEDWLDAVREELEGLDDETEETTVRG